MLPLEVIEPTECDDLLGLQFTANMNSICAKTIWQNNWQVKKKDDCLREGGSATFLIASDVRGILRHCASNPKFLCKHFRSLDGTMDNNSFRTKDASELVVFLRVWNFGRRLGR